VGNPNLACYNCFLNSFLIVRVDGELALFGFLLVLFSWELQLCLFLRHLVVNMHTVRIFMVNKCSDNFFGDEPR